MIKINNKPVLKKKKITKRTVFKRYTNLNGSTYPLPTKRYGTRKKHNNKNYFKFLFKFVFLIGIVVLCMFGFNFLIEYLDKNFFVNEIEVKGCKNISKSEIINILPFQVGDGLLKVKLCEAKKNLGEKKPEFKNVSISRKWFDKKVVISLKERVPEVFVYIGDKKMGLDFDNKPFDLVGDMSTMTIPTIKFAGSEEKKILLTFFKHIKQYLKKTNQRITNIKCGDVNDIILTLDDKINIYWGLPKENKIKDKFQKLQKILDDVAKRKLDIQTIDLSYIDENKNMVIVKRMVDCNK